MVSEFFCLIGAILVIAFGIAVCGGALFFPFIALDWATNAMENHKEKKKRKEKMEEKLFQQFLKQQKSFKKTEPQRKVLPAEVTNVEFPIKTSNPPVVKG